MSAERSDTLIGDDVVRTLGQQSETSQVLTQVKDGQVTITSTNKPEDLQEGTTVTATVTTRIGDKVMYLVEATQAGIFEAANIPEEQLEPLLGIVCPTMLYPYLRAAVADAINRTSLPALHLTEVNFQSLYEQRLAQQSASADGQPLQA